MAVEVITNTEFVKSLTKLPRKKSSRVKARLTLMPCILSFQCRFVFRHKEDGDIVVSNTFAAAKKATRYNA